MSSPLLRIPLELRFQIYAYLSRDTPRSYPFRSPSPISAVDHLGPELNLLLTCRPLLEEIHDYYYGRATFRFYSEGVSSGDSRYLTNPAAMAAIRRLRKVEFVLLWGVKPRKIVPEIMRAWLARQVSLLRDESPYLHSVTVSVRGVDMQEYDSEFRRGLLAPLVGLKGRVKFTLGDVNAEDREEELREELQRVLEEFNVGL